MAKSVSWMSTFIFAIAFCVCLISANMPVARSAVAEISDSKPARYLLGSAAKPRELPRVKPAKPPGKLKKLKIVPNPPSSQRIAGGVNVKRNAYPYVVFIQMNGGRCTGTLIHKYAVLTAAHCVASKQTKAATVKIAMVDQKQSRTSYDTISVKLFIWPRSYSLTKSNGVNEHDIALVILSKASRFTPVALAPRTATFKHLQGVTAVGWGKQASTQTSVTRYLQMQNFPILNDKTCGRYIQANKNMICTGWVLKANSLKRPINICRGDSGGPLLMKTGSKMMVVGVVSGGIGDCSRRTGVTLNANVALWRSWLDSMLRKYAKPGKVPPGPKPLPPRPLPPPPPPDYDYYEYYDYDYYWY
jgi:secreted trypsin-like serine protease